MAGARRPFSFSNERRLLERVEIVELRACLPSNCQHVLKPFGGHECCSCAPALEQSISANGGPVHDLDLCQFKAGRI